MSEWRSCYFCGNLYKEEHGLFKVTIKEHGEIYGMSFNLCRGCKIKVMKWINENRRKID